MRIVLEGWPIRGSKALLHAAAVAATCCGLTSSACDNVTMQPSYVLSECGDGETRACRSACGEGTEVCEGRHWKLCSAPQPAVETCDGRDNDCDGDIDEGFDVGRACTTPAGCRGRWACGADASGTTCVVSDADKSAEVCDGLDNDCDGKIDYVVTDSHIVYVCDCVSERLSFGADPQAQSRSTQGNPTQDGGPLCAKTVCGAESGALDMAFCLNCRAKPEPWTMCESSLSVDLTNFATGDLALTTKFTFDSDAPAKARVNLYYEVEVDGADGATLSVRRYLPLLGVGDLPGPYTRSFLNPHTCQGGTTGFDCNGSIQTCSACREHATCGEATGSDCSKLSFRAAHLQLAVEDCGGDDVQGGIRIQELFLGPAACNSSAP